MDFLTRQMRRLLTRCGCIQNSTISMDGLNTHALSEEDIIRLRYQEACHTHRKSGSKDKWQPTDDIHYMQQMLDSLTFVDDTTAIRLSISDVQLDIQD